MSIFLCCPCPEPASIDWFKIASLFFPLLLALVGYIVYIRQLRQSTKENLLKSKYDKTILALEKCWSLLAYMNQAENPHSVVFFEKPAEKNIYYFHIENGRRYITELNEIFYVSGSGLFLSKEIKHLLFEYRSIIFGMLLSERNNKESVVVIQTDELREKLRVIHDELIPLIKSDLDNLQPDFHLFAKQTQGSS